MRSTYLNKLIMVVLIAITSLTSANSHAEGDNIKIGLLPYLSPDLLMTRYTPLITYVGKELGKKPLPSSALNFQTYIERAANYEYELYITAPHFAALAEKELGFKRVARLTRELDGAIVVHADSDFQKIEQLKGKRLATPDRLAIITILGEQALKDHGIDPSKDIIIKSAPSHNTALLEVIEKRADAAVVSAAVFESMDPTLKQKLRLIFSTDRVPHMMLLASPKIPEKEYQQLKTSVLNYTATGAGKHFFEESGYIDMQPISESDMDKMKAMLPLLTPRLE